MSFYAGFLRLSSSYTGWLSLGGSQLRTDSSGERENLKSSRFWLHALLWETEERWSVHRVARDGEEAVDSEAPSNKNGAETPPS
jgi:hypothetical protein